MSNFIVYLRDLIDNSCRISYTVIALIDVTLLPAMHSMRSESFLQVLPLMGIRDTVVYISGMLELWQVKHRRVVLTVSIVLTTIVICISLGFGAAEIFRTCLYPRLSLALM